MNKFGLLLFTTLIVSTVYAQPAFSFTAPLVNFNLDLPHIAATHPDQIQGNNFFAEADKLEREGDLNTALSTFGKAAFSYNNAKAKSLYALTLMRMSNLHLLLKNYQAAADVVLNVVLKTYTKLGSKTGEMNAYKQLGKVYLASNRFSESLWFLTQQGILAQRLSNKSSYIESIVDMARLKIKRKEYGLAAADLNRAELAAKNAKLTRFKADIFQTRALIAENKGK